MTAEYRAIAEAHAQHIHMCQPVQQRQDCGFFAHRRRKRVGRRLKIVGLAAQKDEIERLAQRISREGRRAFAQR